jgi:hypothetical protein
MDALMIDSVDFKPRYTRVLSEFARSVADDIFNEYGVVEGLHGHVAFVWAFEEGVNRGGGGPLCDFYEFLNPDEFPKTVFALRTNCQSDEATLVVGAVVTDFF